MQINPRELLRLTTTALTIAAPGVLIDADHWYAVVMGWPNGRWLHYTLASTPLVLILLSALWGFVATALTVGWATPKPAALDAPTIQLPHLAPPARATDAPPRDD
jgi:hypothetical protein